MRWPRLLGRHLPVLPDAACAGWPEPLWDADLDQEDPEDRRRRHADAYRVCDRCLVRWQCLQVGRQGETGIWGGLLMPATNTSRKAG